MSEELKDVHTEHCCLIHGRKYSDEDCIVMSGERLQNYLCESCQDSMWDKVFEVYTKTRKEKSIADALSVENERLREALGKIANTQEMDGYTKQEIAEQALKKPNSEEPK